MLKMNKIMMILGFTLLSAFSGVKAQQAFDIAKIEFPADQKFSYFDMVAPNSFTAIGQTETNYFLYKNSALTIIPLTVVSKDYYPGSVDASGTALFYNTSTCKVLKYNSATNTATEIFSGAGLQSCNFENMKVNASGQAIFVVSSSNIGIPYFYDGTSSTVIFTDFNGSNYTSLELFALKSDGTVYGKYAKLVSGAVEAKFYKYTKAGGVVNITFPNDSNFAGISTHSSYHLGDFVDSQNVIYLGTNSANFEPLYYLWNPETGVVTSSASTNYQSYTLAQGDYLYNYPGTEISYLCGFPNSLGYNSVSPKQILPDGNILAHVYTKADYSGFLAVLTPNSTPFTNYCDAKLQVSVLGACSKHLRKTETNISFKPAARGKSCQLKMSVKALGKKLKNYTLQLKNTSASIRKKSDTNGFVYHNFKVSNTFRYNYITAPIKDRKFYVQNFYVNE